MIDRKELIRAMKCANTLGGCECIKEKCPYFTHVGKNNPERIEFEKEHGEFPEDFWEVCDFERMNRDAIILLENEHPADTTRVFHPVHYNKDGRPECWEMMRDIFGDAAVAIFDCLNAFKYIYRAGEKDGNPKLQDSAKAENYMRHAEQMLEGSEGLVTYSQGNMVLRKMQDVMEQWKGGKF